LVLKFHIALFFFFLLFIVGVRTVQKPKTGTIS